MADAAWVDVLPSLRGFVPELKKQLGSSMPKAGQQAGEDFSRGLVSSVERASSQLAAARRKEADAAGAVRVAEARLQDLRDSGRAKSAQLVAAEEARARALRTVESAQEGVTRAQAASERASRAGASGLSEVNRQGGLVARTFGGVRTAVAAGFAAFYAAQTAVRFIGDSIGAARDLNETVNKSNIIFGENAGQVDKWARGAARNLGLSRAAALDAAAGFGNMFTQLGFTADASADLSMQVVQMSADLGSFNNVGTEDVAARISAAFRGEYDALQQLIPNISDARVQQEAMAATGKTNAAQLTAQEKAAAVLAIVQKDGTAAMGDFARTSGGLANQQRILSAEWDNAKARLGALLVGPATAFTGWITNLLPKVEAFAGWVRRNADWLVPLAAALGGIVVAVKLWTVAQGLLNAVMNANPILRIVTILAALVAAVITAYRTSETFRKIVDTAFRVVAEAGRWMWENVLQPVFRALQAAWTAVATAIAWAWNNIIRPTWEALRTAITFLWSNVLRPTFTAVSTAWNAVGTAIGWVWNNLIRPIWDGVSAAIRGLWNNVLRPVFSAISAAWDAVGRAIGTVYRNFIKPILDGFGAAVQWVKSTFQTAVDGIERIWNTIKAILRAPVQWVIDVVWNNGLRKLWNWINNLWGGDDLAEFKFAEGGTIPTRLGAGGRSLRLADGGTVPGYTPGRDVHRFFSPTAGLLELSGGEAVLRPEITRALGTATIDQWNAAARAGGVTGFRRAIAQGSMRTEGRPPQSFAKGGTISLPGWLDTSLNFLGAPIAAAARAVLNPINNSGGEGNGLWGDMIWGLVKNTASKLWEKAKSLFDSGAALAPGSGGGGRFAVQPNGWPARILGVVSPNVARAISAVRALFPAITSVGTIGSRSYASDHPWGKAADFMLPGWNLPSGRALGYQVADYLSQLSTQVGLKYLIFNNQFSSGSGWGPYYYPGGGVGNATTMHLDHVHASFYDQGGPVPPGMSVVYNGTRGAEVARILTPEQDWTFRRAMAGGEGTAAAPSEVTGAKFYGPVILQDLDTLMREQNRAARRAMAAAGFR